MTSPIPRKDLEQPLLLDRGQGAIYFAAPPNCTRFTADVISEV